MKALDTAHERLKIKRKFLAANFPGPFDDFRAKAMMLSSDIDFFRGVEAQLEKASKFSDVPGLAVLAYATQPSDHVVANVKRILESPIDQNIAGNLELPHLGLCARIGGMARSESIANLVVNRCIFIARRSKRQEAATDIFQVIVDACAAYADLNQYRAQIGEAATRLCFTIDDAADLKNLIAIFDVLSMRDLRLTAVLGRASAIAKTKTGR